MMSDIISGPTERVNALPALTPVTCKEATLAPRRLIRERRPRQDLTGQKFGKLTVKLWAGDSRWQCECECGGFAIVLTANLKRGNTASCGCVKRISSSKRATTHGLSNTRAYKTWLSVRRRCFDTHTASYQQYGARGISMDDEWAADPVAFIRDIGQPPSDNHTLDRIDNTKGYFPGNVRWATPLEQGSNKSNNVIVQYQGETYTLSQLCRKIAAEINLPAVQFAKALDFAARKMRRDGDV